MRLDPTEHRRHPWRAHDLTKDFVFDELWEYPVRAIDAHGENFATFCAFIQAQSAPRGLVGALFAFRRWLGGVLGWDRGSRALPIPGCAETSLRDRLPSEERVPNDIVSPDAFGFTLVYDRPDERLLEISNATIHAALHLCWVDKADGTHAPRLAVYWKPRGLLGRMYMHLITPFRRLVVYPGLMRAVGRAWARRNKGHP